MFSRIAAVSAVLVVAVGCSGAAKVEERDYQALKEYADSLERRNADLEGRAREAETLQDAHLVARTQDELYQQIADTLKVALDAFRHDGDGVTFDPKTGRWIMGTDLLFDSGSWVVSARGQEILKKFAEAHKDKPVRFRIVGHTDRAPIVRKTTKDGLDTDTNMELSVRRSIAVMGSLKKFGLVEKQFTECIGMGNQQPAAPNDRTAANMKKNRRVEIFVLK